MPVNSRREANLRDAATSAVTQIRRNSRETKRNRSTARRHTSERVRSQLPFQGSTNCWFVGLWTARRIVICGEICHSVGWHRGHRHRAARLADGWPHGSVDDRLGRRRATAGDGCRRRQRLGHPCSPCRADFGYGVPGWRLTSPTATTDGGGESDQREPSASWISDPQKSRPAPLLTRRRAACRCFFRGQDPSSVRPTAPQCRA